MKNFAGGGLAEVRSNFAKYGLLSDRIVFLKGMFADDFPTAPFTRLALITARRRHLRKHPRLPGPSLSRSCRRAAIASSTTTTAFPIAGWRSTEYRQQNQIRDEIMAIDQLWRVFWKKS